MTVTDRLPDQAPAGHPRVPAGRIGVLIGNLGTPDATDYWSMRRYLSQFLSDRRVIDYSPVFWQPLLQLVILSVRPQKSGAAYRSIWNDDANESPLMTITRQQRDALAASLARDHGDRVEVDFCMRYGNPSSAAALARLAAKGCTRILYFPLYPQYSAATTATACDDVFRALMKMRWQPAVRTVAPYFDEPDYIEALADSVRTALDGLDHEPDAIVASYHGLPKRYLEEGDPYHCHCLKTSRLLSEALDLPAGRLVSTFQSRFGREEWLQPYTVEEVARLARDGRKRIAVLAPAFASDCIETLEEIREEIRDAFIAAGGEEFTYIPCLNADDAHVRVLTRIVNDNLAGWT